MGFHMCIWYQRAVLHVADMNFWRYLDSDLVFDPCDPKWPRIKKKWSNNFCRGAQTLSYAHVTWSCYAICRRSSNFSENNLFWPLWPWKTFDSVKGHKTYAGWVIDYCDQVSLKSIKAAWRYIRLYGWQKKRRRIRIRRRIRRKNHRKNRIQAHCMRLYKKNVETRSSFQQDNR